MDFELDAATGILHVTSEVFDSHGFFLNMFNEVFFEYLREFFLGKHLKSMGDFISNWNSLKEEFSDFMNLRFFSYAIGLA